MTTPPFGFISKASNHNAVQLSIIIPFLNEREVLSLCHARLTPILQSLSESYEIVFVDDGSTDDCTACAGFNATQFAGVISIV